MQGKLSLTLLSQHRNPEKVQEMQQETGRASNKLYPKPKKEFQGRLLWLSRKEWL